MNKYDKIEMILDEGDPGFFSTIEEAVAYYIEKYGEDIQVLWVDEDTRLCYVQTNDQYDPKVLGYFTILFPDELVAGVIPAFDLYLVDAKKADYKFYHEFIEGRTDTIEKYGQDLTFTYDPEYNCYSIYKGFEYVDRFYVYKIAHPALKDYKGRSRGEWLRTSDIWKGIEWKNKKARKVMKLWDKAVNAVKAKRIIRTVHDIIDEHIDKYIEAHGRDINWTIIGLDPQPEVACLYYKLTNLKGDEVLGYFTIDVNESALLDNIWDLNDETALKNTYDILENWLRYRGWLTYDVDPMNDQQKNMIIQYGKNLQFFNDGHYEHYEVSLDSLDGYTCAFRFCISVVPLKDYPKPGEFRSINEEKGYK